MSAHLFFNLVPADIVPYPFIMRARKVGKVLAPALEAAATAVNLSFSFREPTLK